MKFLALFLLPAVVQASATIVLGDKVQCEDEHSYDGSGPISKFHISSVVCHSSTNYVQLDEADYSGSCTVGQHMQLTVKVTLSEPVYSSMKVGITVGEEDNGNGNWWRQVRKSYSTSLSLLPYTGNDEDLWMEAGDHEISAYMQIPSGLNYLFSSQGDEVLAQLTFSPSKTYNNEYGQFLTKQWTCSTTVTAVNREEAANTYYGTAFLGLLGSLITSAFFVVRSRRRRVAATTDFQEMIA